MFNQFFFPKLRNSIHTFGLIVALVMPGCATTPKLTNKKLPKNILGQQTSLALKKQKSIDAQSVRNQMERLKKSLAKGTLSESDWWRSANLNSW